jgi:PAS domain S-box-containing protein
MQMPSLITLAKDKTKNRTSKTPKNFHEVLLEHVRGLVFVKDSDYKLVYANKAFLNLYPPDIRDKVIGAHSADNFAEEEAQVFNAEDRQALDTGFSEIVEEISDYKGQKFMFHTQKIRFTDEQGNTRILGIGTDITRQVERERLLAQSNLALQSFAAVAAHDLRSPLAALSVSLEAIQKDKDTLLGAKAARHIQLMNTCLEGLMDQVAQLLATCKIDPEDQTPAAPCEISLLFEEVKFGLSSQIEKANAKLLSTELPCIIVRRAMFRQLLHNLIENSLKYRSTAKPIIILRYHAQNGEHVFSIEDNGIGVAPEHRDAMFQFSAQADEKSAGYGIGLALCKKIIETHGGKIWLDTYYTSGCKICFSIPA